MRLECLIAIAILLRELKTQGPLSWIEDSLIRDDASGRMLLGGPWRELRHMGPLLYGVGCARHEGIATNAPDVEWHRVGDSFTLTIR